MGMVGAGTAKNMVGKAGATTKTMGLGQHAIGIGIAVGMEAMGSGKGFGNALAKGAFWYAADALVPGAFWLSTLGSVAGGVTQAYIDEKRYGNARVQKYYQGNFGGNFRDSQGGYTMRQRGVAAMQQSKLNARSVLGSEARTFHTS